MSVPYLLKGINRFIQIKQIGKRAYHKEIRQIGKSKHLRTNEHRCQKRIRGAPKDTGIPQCRGKFNRQPKQRACCYPKACTDGKQGVTSPPWKPAANVSTVRRNFNIQSYP